MNQLKYNEKVRAYVDPAAIGLLSETEKAAHRSDIRPMTLTVAQLILQHGLVQQVNAPGTLADVDRLMAGLQTRLRLVAAPLHVLHELDVFEPPVYSWLNADTRSQFPGPVYTAIPMTPQPRSFFFEQYGLNEADNNDQLQETGISPWPITTVQRDILMSYLQPAVAPPGTWD